MKSHDRVGEQQQRGERGLSGRGLPAVEAGTELVVGPVDEPATGAQPADGVPGDEEHGGRLRWRWRSPPLGRRLRYSGRGHEPVSGGASPARYAAHRVHVSARQVLKPELRRYSAQYGCSHR
ncbi:hypothetical protein [Streptomyces sp. NBC_00356]|uniref:hypothetical protein n=1 Tax=Streptomyces sp. NBC_00356 TaxID=2975724 RepID=UPI002E272A92